MATLITFRVVRGLLNPTRCRQYVIVEDRMVLAVAAAITRESPYRCFIYERIKGLRRLYDETGVTLKRRS